MTTPVELKPIPDEIWLSKKETKVSRFYLKDTPYCDRVKYTRTPSPDAGAALEENWGNSRLFKNLRKHKVASAHSNDDEVDAQFIVYESDLILLAMQLDKMSSSLTECYATIDRMNEEKQK